MKIQGVSAFTIEMKENLPEVTWLTVNVIPRRHGDLTENDYIYKLLRLEGSLARLDDSVFDHEAKEMMKILLD